MAVNPESDDTMMANIFVTRQIPAAGLKPLPDTAKVVVSPLDRELTPQELIEQTRDCRILVCTPANLIDAALFDRRPHIRLVANYGAGVDRIDLAAAQAHDVVVTNTPGVLSATTANMAMTIILAVCNNRQYGHDDHFGADSPSA
jgi:glyoxylate reductase